MNRVRRVRHERYFIVKRLSLVAKVSPSELLRMTQILALGIPLDDVVMENLRASSLGLSICQTGTVLENTIFDLKDGGTGYLVSIAINNNSAKTMRIDQYRLEQPWPESGFHWLEDPLKKMPRESIYSFPKYGPEGLERECVLNHRVGRHSRLLPGDCIEGLLCGVGQAYIPDEYHHRQRLSMRLSVFDGRGQETDLIIDVILNREVQIWHQRQREAFKRRGAGILGPRYS